MINWFFFDGRDHHGGYHSVNQRVKFSLAIHPGPAISSFLVFDYTSPLADMALDSLV
jgi:hypothetical protein